MSEILKATSLEQLLPYKNKKEYVEMVVRRKDGKIKKYINVLIDQSSGKQVSEINQKAIQLLNKNTMLNERNNLISRNV